MRIILETYSTNPDYNADCDYAAVELTPFLVEQIRQRVALARQAGQQDTDLYELYFWGGTAEFYERAILDAYPESLETDLERDGHARLPGEEILSSREPQRTECDQMVVRCSLYRPDPEFEIAWTASPKHSDVYVTTRELRLEALEAYVQGEKAKAADAEHDAH